MGAIEKLLAELDGCAGGAFGEVSPDDVSAARAELAALESLLREARELRPAVLRFALQMEENLRANDHKGGWESCDEAYLLTRLAEEVHELLDADGNPKQIVHEAADVGNFAMMLSEKALALLKEAS